MNLALVLDPNQSAHRRLARRLKDALVPGEELHLHHVIGGVADGGAAVSRWPGEAISGSITVLLLCPEAAAAADLAARLPAKTLLLAEWNGEEAWAWGESSGLHPLLTRNPRSSLAILTRQPTPEGADAATPSLECLVQASLPTLARWPRQHERLLDAAADYLLGWLRLCEQRRELLRICPKQNVRFTDPVPLTSRRRWQAHAQWALQGLRRRLNTTVLGGSERPWHIAIGRLEPAQARSQLLHRLGPDPAGWYADPFLIEEGSRTWMFCERWQAQQGRGVIDLFEVTREGLVPAGTVLEEPFHLSFPRVLHHNGSWYATVESTDHHDVRLYEAVAFPHRWRLCRVLLSNGDWADPVLLHHADGWFLLTSTCSSRAIPRETAPELHLFHSHDLLHEPFRPHPCSPLMVDSQAGRNGGAFHRDGHFYRVSQQTGFNDAYGRSLELQQIEILTSTSYRERGVQPASAWLTTLLEQLPATHVHSLTIAGHWISVDYRPARR